MWWKQRSQPEIPLTDEQFNAALDNHVKHLLHIISDPSSEFFPMAIVIRNNNVEINALVEADEAGAEFDIGALATSFGLSLRSNRYPPQAVIFVFLAKANDGSEVIVSHGATLDGRHNAAIVDVDRDQNGHLRAGGQDIRHYPAKNGELPKLNYAAEILTGYSR